VSTTTNGTMTKELIQELFDKGLVSINISVHGLDVNTFLNSQRVKNEKWAKTMLDIQKENIEYLLLKNLEFKINTVVSGMDDINNSLYIYQFCKEKNIPMRILDNLIQKEKAKVAINSILEIV
jgi:molybdenum cofactor biosynthesis enzyme MoaA